MEKQETIRQLRERMQQIQADGGHDGRSTRSKAPHPSGTRIAARPSRSARSDGSDGRSPSLTLSEARCEGPSATLRSIEHGAHPSTRVRSSDRDARSNAAGFSGARSGRRGSVESTHPANRMHSTGFESSVLRPSDYERSTAAPRYAEMAGENAGRVSAQGLTRKLEGSRNQNRSAQHPNDQQPRAFGSSGTAVPVKQRMRAAGRSAESRTLGDGASDVCDDAPRAKELTAHDALKKIMKLASVRERSQTELSRRLATAGFDEECIHEAINQAVAWGIINDRRFADALVRTRIAQDKGCPGIERELKDNGIDPSILTAWPDDYIEGRGSEIDRASRLLNRKPPRAKNQLQSAYRKLVVNGYASDVAMRAARAWCAKEEAAR